MELERGRLSPWGEWAAAGRPLPGEPESADRHVVVPRPDGVLIAVLDGLGHGAEAAQAAEKAAAAIRDHAAGSVESILNAAHAALAGSRGAVATVATIEAATGALAWAGIGDVDAVLHSASGKKRESLLLLPGVLGDRVPRIRTYSLALGAGDVLVIATDGLKRAFADERVLRDPVEVAAERILERHARPTDDALVLIFRYLEGA